MDCVYAETSLKRKDPPGDAAKNAPPLKTVRRNIEGEDTQFNQGYLLLQNGGRSRYIENTFWACVDVEVTAPLHPRPKVAVLTRCHFQGLELDSLLSDLPLFPLEDV